MGDEADETGGKSIVTRAQGSRGPLRRVADWKPITRLIEEPKAVLCERYSLPDDYRIFALLNTVQEYGTRDLMPDWTEATFLTKRKAAFEDAGKIISDTKELRGRIDALRHDAAQFCRDYDDNPVLMADVFNADFGLPSELFMPESMQAFHRVFADETLWREVDSRLAAIADMPIVSELPHGRIAHVTLKKVVQACREYWREQGRIWDDHELSELKDDDDFDAIQEETGRFVVDVLMATQFPFEMRHLRRAWRSR